MSPILFADNFLAGSVLSLLLPITLLIVVALWFAHSYRHIYDDVPESAAALPTPEVLEAAIEADIETMDGSSAADAER